MITRKQAFFFDLDDTLYDHFVPFEEAVSRLLTADEQATDTARLFRQMRHHSDQLWPSYEKGELELAKLKLLRIELACKDCGLMLDRSRLEQFQRDYLQRQRRFDWISGARECILRLMEAGHPVGIITNGPEDYQWAKIRGLGLDHFIARELIFISGALGLAKPDPELFAFVNRLTGTLPPECVYIGDSWDKDVTGALAAGWQVYWYNPRGQRPGDGRQPHLEFSAYPALNGQLHTGSGGLL
ncbi:HAD family hydrolase [Paenibacillus typhae]|uniref:HAD family hydrolase n=1 Tax=Paenibacillus typhae TaxID=1174501 RepID=UPI001C8DF82C|nr:HAD-IA family hydrolase [Paenibacillus typhae]MBY0011599.1 HAD-IA family hydrolase [Paenibacillus typhae]